MVTILSPADPRAEAIRALRTHVMAQHINLGRRALAVCAPNANVGCSFVAANLAVSLSQIGVNTLLIDGDLRRPMLDVLIRPPQPTRGLAQCLQSPDKPFGADIDDGTSCRSCRSCTRVMPPPTPRNSWRVTGSDRS